MVPVRYLVRLAAAALALASALGAARADEDSDSDHDLARDLHERGEILSYEEIARTARETVPGDIVGVALEHTGPRWTYVIQIVDTDGHRVTLDIDAESAKLIDRSPTDVETP